MRRLTAHLIAASALLFAATPVFAEGLGLSPLELARIQLKNIYNQRADLQASFGPDGVATPYMKSRGLASLDEWAVRYGINEYPALLYPMAGMVPASSSGTTGTSTPQLNAGNVAATFAKPRALVERTATLAPVKVGTPTFAPKVFTATSVLVIDDATRKVLLSRNADKQWPIASISKLMTALVSLENGIDMNASCSILAQDEVGGARVRVDNGTRLTVRQVFDSVLVGSANNAANALARVTGLTKPQFVAAMNARAQKMGMPQTKFADPSGIETDNVSTAEGVAALAFEAFESPHIKRATTTSEFTFLAASQTHNIKNTNWLLTDPNNGLFVMGGKTGYLIESKWNFVVKMKDYRNRPVLVVVLGSSDRQQSFNDATAAAKWVWANYRWTKS